MTGRDALRLFVIALHPAWNVARVLDVEALPLGALGNATLVLPLVEGAYLLEVGLCCLLALGMQGSVWHGNRAALPPAGLKQTASGFTATLRGPLDLRLLLRNAALGLVASTWGIFVLQATAAGTRPELYPVGTGLVPLWLYLGLTVIGHGVIQGGAMLAFMAARWMGRTKLPVALEGRVLRIGGRSLTLSGKAHLTRRSGVLKIDDEGQKAAIVGPPEGLAWLEQQLRQIQERGDSSEVPRALEAVATAAKAAG